MKNLKINFVKICVVLCILCVAAACKKSQVNGDNTNSGTFIYQGQTMSISDADYRSGNGDGAWIYLMTSDFNTVQIRFGGLADYAIPEGAFSLNGNLKGGQVIINNASNEFSAATGTITKNGDKYHITLTANTAKGKITVNFNEQLKKI